MKTKRRDNALVVFIGARWSRALPHDMNLTAAGPHWTLIKPSQVFMLSVRSRYIGYSGRLSKLRVPSSTTYWRYLTAAQIWLAFVPPALFNADTFDEWTWLDSSSLDSRFVANSINRICSHTRSTSTSTSMTHMRLYDFFWFLYEI